MKYYGMNAYLRNKFFQIDEPISLNKLLFLKIPNSYYGLFSHDDNVLNKFIFQEYFNFLKDSYYYRDEFDGNTLPITQILDSILNDTYIQDHKKEFDIIPNDKYSSFIYQKRSYNLAEFIIGYSNISVIQFYYENKHEIDKLYLDYKAMKANQNKNNYYGYTHTEMKEMQNVDLNSEYGQLLKKYNYYKSENVKIIPELNDAMEKTTNKILDYLNTDNYSYFEFNDSSFSDIFIILFDYFISIKNKKMIYKIFSTLHDIANKKNKEFFSYVYDKNIRSKKPLRFISNNPMFMLYYLNFYKTFNKGKYYPKVVKKYNQLIVLLISLKLYNDCNAQSDLDLTSIQKLFNKSKLKKDFSLQTFIKVDKLISEQNIENILDIAEQNNEIFISLLNNTTAEKTNMFYYNTFEYQNGLDLEKSNPLELWNEKFHNKSIPDETIERFWNLIENSLINANMTAKHKKEILKTIRNIDGFDKFAMNCDPSLQSIICEILIS